MKKRELQEEFFKYLTETSSSGAEKISNLAAREIKATALAPPDALWLKIQKKIADDSSLQVVRQSSSQVPESIGFGARLRSLFSAPLMPALALSAVGILVGAFLLLNQGSAPSEMPLVEISAATPRQKGDILIAQGVRIENLGSGSISRVSGSSDKIILASGAWQMVMNHKELSKPLQFIFPGGALEPLGTAFTITIGADGTAIKLTEGKIRLYDRTLDGKKWRAQDVTAPFTGTLKNSAVETEIQIENVIVEKKKEAASKYSNYVGKNITIELKNGDRLSGKLRAAKGGVLSLASASGDLHIREREIVRVNKN